MSCLWARHLPLFPCCFKAPGNLLEEEFTFNKLSLHFWLLCLNSNSDYFRGLYSAEEVEHCGCLVFLSLAFLDENFIDTVCVIQAHSDGKPSIKGVCSADELHKTLWRPHGNNVPLGGELGKPRSQTKVQKPTKECCLLTRGLSWVTLSCQQWGAFVRQMIY